MRWILFRRNINFILDASMKATRDSYKLHNFLVDTNGDNADYSQYFK